MARLHQLNARTWLTARARQLGRAATLDDLDDGELDRLAELGFSWLYLLGAWRTGEAGRRVSRAEPAWREEFARVLPDLREEDVCGSCFAVTGYELNPALGDDAALARLRRRLADRGLRLMLDFVPNHTAPDHPWVRSHPDRYVAGTEALLRAELHNYTRVDGRVLAYGRDPYFAGWPDTLQLDYASDDLQAAMVAELQRVAERADGVRCDMAMLLLPDVFERTWGRRPAPFWPDALAAVRAAHPGFTSMAEVYWDLEWELQQQGFDLTYDKRLYDRLVARDAAAVRGHLRAAPDFQARSARFLENHDEPRAAAVFTPEEERAAATIAFLCPGLGFLHHGQVEGWRVKVPTHLCRGPEEPNDGELAAFHRDLLAACRRVDGGRWRLIEPRPAWDGNPSSEAFVGYLWDLEGGGHLLVAVNYAPHASQCYLPVPAPLGGRVARLVDRLGPEVHERSGDDLVSRGLYLDVPAWRAHVFEISAS
jgi:hypothetical protein